MSGIGKQNMLDTINDQPNYKICKQVPSLITKSKLSKASKNLRKIGVALRYFAPRHPPEKVGKKAGRRGGLRKLELHAMKFPATPWLSLSPRWQKWPSLPCSTWTTWKEPEHAGNAGNDNNIAYNDCMRSGVCVVRHFQNRQGSGHDLLSTAIF